MEHYPSYRRLDVGSWSRSKFYPGCFLWLVPRTVLILGTVFGLGVVQRILYFQRDMDVPLEGWRRRVHKKFLRVAVPLVIGLFGYRVEMTDYSTENADVNVNANANADADADANANANVDYSDYLGPHYGDSPFLKNKKRVSTIVSNHVGFLEMLAYLHIYSDTPPAFLPATQVKDFPIGDHYCKSLQCIYVDRNLPRDQRNETIKTLGNRQKLIETDDTRDWGPICIFAEGSVTNGKNLSRFRRGAFCANVPVQPHVLKFRYTTVAPDYTLVQGLELAFLMLSTTEWMQLLVGGNERGNVVEVHRYPVFVPNDYLYHDYASTMTNDRSVRSDSRPELWEIYAHAVEDLMRKQGGFGKNQQALREKIALQKFVWGETDSIRVNGRTFYWPPRSDDDIDDIDDIDDCIDGEDHHIKDD
jgi:hypothetical protein